MLLPQKNGAGLMRVEGYVTMSGVFPYPQPDGTVLREWRPPSEVADATSLDSLKLAPITIEHPDESVTIANVKALSVGTVGDDVRIEMLWPDETSSPKPAGESTPPNVKVRCRLGLTDAKAIKIIEDRELPEVSCGYSADLEMVTGITPDGDAYDAIQRRIAYNHLAIGVVGRQGPDVAIRVDHKHDTKKEQTQMEKLIIDGVSFDAPKQTIEAFTANQAKAAQRLADAVVAITVEKTRADAAVLKAGEEAARADAAGADVKKAQAETKKAQEAIKAGVRERLSLERGAIKVMGAEAFETAKLGDADDEDLRAAVVKHVNPDLDITEKAALASKGDIGAAGYLRALFDIAVSKRADAVDESETVEETPRADSAGSLARKSATATTPIDAGDKARAARLAKRADAWRPKA